MGFIADFFGFFSLPFIGMAMKLLLFGALYLLLLGKADQIKESAPTIPRTGYCNAARRMEARNKRLASLILALATHACYVASFYALFHNRIAGFCTEYGIEFIKPATIGTTASTILGVGACFLMCWKIRGFVYEFLDSLMR